MTQKKNGAMELLTLQAPRGFAYTCILAVGCNPRCLQIGEAEVAR